MTMDEGRIVVVSNRLPLSVVREGDAWGVRASSGGLVTALGPVLRDRGGVWIGWLGLPAEDLPPEETVEDLLTRAEDTTGHEVVAIPLTREEIRGYYEGFSNSVLWPLFHDFISRCDYRPESWDTYVAANRRFAETVASRTRPSDYVWVHDYQLLLVAQALRSLGVDRKTGFFLHIPFPPPDVFMKLPWRQQVLEALLEYELVGFQTARDRRNFLDCVNTLAPGARIAGRGGVVQLVTPKRVVRVGTFPISIDFREFSDGAESPEVEREAWITHVNLPDRKLILGVDRLDYTKGIPQRLHAFASALERYPDLHRNVSLVQVVVPSRIAVDEYDVLKREIERTVGEINGRFTRSGWIPVHYVYRHLDRVDLLALYRTAEVALITPLKDGMNLVAKEYCAASVEDEGVLILSEFAGAAAQLRQNALLVNPWDIIGTADAIHRALTMPAEERRARMRRLRASIRRHDIGWWVRSFLGAARGVGLDDFRGPEQAAWQAPWNPAATS